MRLGSLSSDADVLRNLEVVHSHINKVRAALKSQVESVLGLHPSGAENLKGDPWLVDGLHQCGNVSRLLGFVSHAIDRLEVEIRVKFLLFGQNWSLHRMGTDSCQQTVLLDKRNHLGQEVQFPVLDERVGDPALGKAATAPLSIASLMLSLRLSTLG